VLKFYRELKALVLTENMATTRSATRSNVKSGVEGDKKYITRSVLENFAPKLFSKVKKNVVFMKEKKEGDLTGKASLKKKQADLSASLASDEGVGDLGPHYSHGFLFDIPAFLARPRHHLKQAWTLWYYRNDRSLSWEENQQAVATVSTIEEFWQLYQLLQPASKLGLGCDYAMFRAGILPDWEDPANVAGGRWIVRRKRVELDKTWLELLFYLIGEHAEAKAGEINGAVVNVRKKGDKVAVWLREARHVVAVVDVGRQVQSRLGLPPGTKMQFSVHREEREWAEDKSGKRLPEILL